MREKVNYKDTENRTDRQGEVVCPPQADWPQRARHGELILSLRSGRAECRGQGVKAKRSVDERNEITNWHGPSRAYKRYCYRDKDSQ